MQHERAVNGPTGSQDHGCYSKVLAVGAAAGAETQSSGEEPGQETQRATINYPWEVKKVPRVDKDDTALLASSVEELSSHLEQTAASMLTELKGKSQNYGEIDSKLKDLRKEAAWSHSAKKPWALYDAILCKAQELIDEEKAACCWQTAPED